MTSRIWEVREALVDLFVASVDDTWVIIDGPVAQTGQPRQTILVGTDGGNDGTGEADADGASTTQEWASIGPQNRRTERGTVLASVWAWSGSTDMAAPRALVRAAVDLLEVAIHTNRKLPGVLPNGGWIELASVALRESQRSSGAVCRAVLTITYEARLRGE